MFRISRHLQQKGTIALVLAFVVIFTISIHRDHVPLLRYLLQAKKSDKEHERESCAPLFVSRCVDSVIAVCAIDRITIHIRLRHLCADCSHFRLCRR